MTCNTIKLGSFNHVHSDLTDCLHVFIEVLAGSQSPVSNKALDHDGEEEEEEAQAATRSQDVSGTPVCTAERGETERGAAWTFEACSDPSPIRAQPIRSRAGTFPWQRAGQWACPCVRFWREWKVELSLWGPLTPAGHRGGAAATWPDGIWRVAAGLLCRGKRCRRNFCFLPLNWTNITKHIQQANTWWQINVMHVL